MFQFFKTPFSTKIKTLTKFAILEPKFMQKFLFQSLKLGQNSVLLSSIFFPKIQFFKHYIFKKNKFFKPPIFGVYPFFKPPFAALWATHLYQNETELSYPPGENSTSTSEQKCTFRHQRYGTVQHSLLQ